MTIVILEELTYSPPRRWRRPALECACVRRHDVRSLGVSAHLFDSRVGRRPPAVGCRLLQRSPRRPAIDRFWTVITAPTAVLVILALIVNWPLTARRRWISRGAILFFVMLAWTVVYFIPKGVTPLMVRGGDGLTPEAITQMARAWIFWDWFRMAGTLGSYLCFVKAATLH